MEIARGNTMIIRMDSITTKYGIALFPKNKLIMGLVLTALPVSKWGKVGIAVKDLSETKMTKQGVGHFTSISGHFSANSINSFHKTEVLTVILMGPTY